MTDPAAEPASSRRAATTEPLAASLLVALFIVGLPLRPQIAAIGPLVPGIIDELGSSFGFVGLLTTIPVLCMGVFALAGPTVAGALGTRGGIVASVAVIVAAGILRAVAPGAELILVATFVIGIGTAVIGPILPMFVRNRMPRRMVGGTSAYAGGTIVGTAIGAALAVPLAGALGGWRGSLLALSIASAAALVAWIALVRPSTSPAARTGAVRPRLPLRRPIAWAIGLLFGLQSWLFYGTTAWLASIYTERGWEPATAALLLSVVSLASFGAIVLAPAGARRGLSRRAMLATAASFSTTGLLGVALLPGPGFLWALLLGCGLGLTFTLLLTLPTDLSDDPREVGGAAALMLLVGYLLASVAPFALGAVRDATGDFEASVWLLVAIGFAMIPLALSLTPARLKRRHIPAEAAA